MTWRLSPLISLNSSPQQASPPRRTTRARPRTGSVAPGRRNAKPRSEPRSRAWVHARAQRRADATLGLHLDEHGDPHRLPRGDLQQPGQPLVPVAGDRQSQHGVGAGREELHLHGIDLTRRVHRDRGRLGGVILAHLADEFGRPGDVPLEEDERGPLADGRVGRAERGDHLAMHVSAPEKGPRQILGGAPGVGATDEDTQHGRQYTQVNECPVTS